MRICFIILFINSISPCSKIKHGDKYICKELHYRYKGDYIIFDSSTYKYISNGIVESEGAYKEYCKYIIITDSVFFTKKVLSSDDVFKSILFNHDTLYKYKGGIIYKDIIKFKYSPPR